MNDRMNGAPGAPDETHDSSDTATRPADAGSHHRTRAEERIAALDATGAGLAEEVERLAAELAEARRAAEEATARWQRSAADLANYRRRTEQERSERMGLASDSLLLKVLTLADDFDLAIAHVPPKAQGSPWVEGIAAIDRKLRALLESEGVTAMEVVGARFDPREHEAVSHEETVEAPDGTVLRELQRGYRVRDRVLRPALVAVARNDHDDPTGRH